MRKQKQEVPQDKRSVFSLVRLGRGAWAVAYRGALIPGAILSSCNAALSYALEVAKAAGLPRARFMFGRLGTH
jgi:hypothetical protein